MTETAKPIEEASLNAWPALRQIIFDGWLLRFSEGYTRRANSVNPIYAGQKSVEEKIRFCQKSYAAQQLPCVFKITPFVQPANLDARLAELGYEKEALTSVQILDLATFAPEIKPEIRQDATPTTGWIDDYVRMNGVQPERVGTLRAILDHIVPATCYATVGDNGQSAACGLGVREGQWLGLFDIVTEPSQRGRGLAEKLITGLLTWGVEHGAQTAYLQVMLNNNAALKLYDRLGFRELYRYWYRVKR